MLFRSGDLRMSDAGFGTIFVSVKIEEKQGMWESLCDCAVGFGF